MQEKARQEKQKVELRQKQQKAKEEQKASPGKHQTGDAGGHEEKAERDKHHKEAVEMDEKPQVEKPQPMEKQKVELREKQPNVKKHVDKADTHHSGDAGGHEDQAERDKHHKEENAKKEKKKHKAFGDREDQKILAVPHHSSPPGKAVALEAEAKPDTRLPMAKAKAAKAAANLKAANLMAKTAKMSAKVAEDVRRLKSASAKRKP
tara:strand:- start:73 stop:690 length:618 start_codon:yes stop_codon:yes gene_type:complete